jgi:hypothetical protein
MPISRGRALRDLFAWYHNPHLQRPTIYSQKLFFQNLIMRPSYGHARIFLPAFTCLDFPNLAISYAKPYVVAPGAGLARMPMGAQA